MHVAQTQRVSLVHGICSDIQDFKTLSHPAGASQPDRPAFPLGTVLIPRAALQGKVFRLSSTGTHRLHRHRLHRLTFVRNDQHNPKCHVHFGGEAERESYLSVTQILSR